MTAPPSLEQRIVLALTEQIKTAAAVADLIVEVEGAILAADKAAKSEREKALDPIASPDAAQAREAMESAEFARDRLRTVLPRLQDRLATRLSTEYSQQWRASYDALKPRRDALAAEFRELYPEVEAKFVDLFKRIAINDAQINALHQDRPAGVALHLLGAELTARNLPSFSTTNPSIIKELKLPNFKHSATAAWPPPQPTLAMSFAQSLVPANDARFNEDWAQERERDNEQKKANHAQWEAEEHRRKEQEYRKFEDSFRGPPGRPAT
jgi:hypothetical protein